LVGGSSPPSPTTQSPTNTLVSRSRVAFFMARSMTMAVPLASKSPGAMPRALCKAAVAFWAYSLGVGHDARLLDNSMGETRLATPRQTRQNPRLPRSRRRLEMAFIVVAPCSIRAPPRHNIDLRFNAFLSNIAHRASQPLQRTAWLSVSMPCNILSRASIENFTSLADVSVFSFV
jgi:hypothetical protein